MNTVGGSGCWGVYMHASLEAHVSHAQSACIPRTYLGATDAPSGYDLQLSTSTCN